MNNSISLTPKQRLHEYALLMRIDKPIGILLLLWPTWWALWIAGEGSPDLLVFTVFTAGVFLMRSAGCVINDYADRNIDGQVERTQNRPLAQKRIAPKEALYLFVGLALTAFVLVLLMNKLTIAMSFVGAILAASYPFMKRFTNLPQVILGTAFAWSIPMAFAAQTGSVPVAAWLLFFATILWTTAYDTMYAMVDRKDDLKIGVKSTAILFGQNDRIIIAGLQIATLSLLVVAGVYLQLGTLYYSGLVIAGGFAVYQQFLIKDRFEKQCFVAFLNNNWFGMVIFAGLFLHYLLT
ncbi:MAG: 4-hydroxybenzoate octaprenyltransferase [Gammaproteobacteria bacterium]|nr:4-hydroxybenzoate octaprenyltransferase [Gammaproteobacteria bacterium]